LRNLNAAGVRYPIVGGYAVMIHTDRIRDRKHARTLRKPNKRK
jgi:hypothetical protein